MRSFWTIWRRFTVAITLLFKVAEEKRSRRRIKERLMHRNHWKEFACMADPAANRWVCFAVEAHCLGCAVAASKLQHQPSRPCCISGPPALEAWTTSSLTAETGVLYQMLQSAPRGASSTHKCNKTATRLQSGRRGREKSEGASAERGRALKNSSVKIRK